ncbi:MAG: carbohydrate porin [Acetobacter sp.]|jgi:porin|nr:carbohydrate porin [Acetobacter sp.]MCH4061105.1 carbohydrate porin [Acetobacter sp.]MCH4088044.1 carbohydrate porin [Acetobacter sp.]MCI1293342.1 carbohydrate porin [Acetobacter sp.]MCI1320033.1 carbohydrate porin [Acetobacter sp.]
MSVNVSQDFSCYGRKNDLSVFHASSHLTTVLAAITFSICSVSEARSQEASGKTEPAVVKAVPQTVTNTAIIRKPTQPAAKAKTAPNHLDALFNTESLSAFLNKDEDSIRESDLAASYYVPIQTFGSLVPQLKQPRKWLSDRGFSFQLSYKSESIANVGGGLSKGMSYTHEITLTTVFDLGKLIGWDGWKFNAVMLERAGRQVSYDHVGEHKILLSEIYSLSGNAAAHLADMYLEKSFYHNKVNINLGRMTLTHTYSTSALLCTFMIQCSAPVAVKSNPGWSVYPRATWGGTVRLRPTRDLSLTTGVYTSGVLQDNPSGWAWGSQSTTGVMVPVELAWEPFFGRDKLVGHYKLGFGHDTARYNDLIGTIPAADQSYVHREKSKPRDTFYIEADQMVYRSHGQNQMAGGYLMAGYIHNTPSISTFTDQVYVGTSLLGIIPFRPLDRFGVMYSYYHLSNRLSYGQRLRQDAGMSMGAFVTGPQTHTATLEAYYSVPVIPGLVLQPVFEYMMRPGESGKIPNATLVGIKVMATL